MKKIYQLFLVYNLYTLINMTVSNTYLLKNLKDIVLQIYYDVWINGT